MDRLDSLMLFVRIVETGSFARAAEMLDIPKPTATHAIKELEKRLGVRLLERTTRRVRTTDDGLSYYHRCVHVLSELEDAEASFQQGAAKPRGVLRVDMSTTHATKIVLPRLGEFHKRYPDIKLVVSSGDRLVDLLLEGVDCVIRAGTPRSSNLVARKLASMPQVLCASPGYLAAYGTPENLDDLKAHHVVSFFSSSGKIDYPLSLIVDGELQEFQPGSWISVNDSENYMLSALQGYGIIQLPRFHADDDLRSGRLIELLPKWQSPALPLTALYPYHRQMSPRIRVFVDWLAELYSFHFANEASGLEQPVS